MAKRDMSDQVTVPITDAQRQFLEQRAVEEDRPVASVVRRCIEAARQQAQHEERAA